MKKIWINGRFLTRPQTGVERVAVELLAAWCQTHVNAQGCYQSPDGQWWQLMLAVPPSCTVCVPDGLACLPQQVVGRWQGHLWEQLDLACLPAEDWLINLCNTAPIFRHKQLVFVHDAQVFAIPHNFNWKFRLWYRLMLRAIMRHAAITCTNSHFSKQELERYLGRDAARLHVLHLGANHMQRLQPKLDPSVEAKLPQQPFILAVSSANPNKNFAYIEQSMAHIEAMGLACVIVGQMNVKSFAHVARSTQVISLGYVDDQTLVALYQRAFCLVFPSFYEGFGLPPLEAMWWGLPVIASHTSAIPEVCDDAVLYCDPLKPDTLWPALATLQDPQIRQHYQQQGQARARQFLWKKASEQMMSFIHKISDQENQQ